MLGVLLAFCLLVLGLSPFCTTATAGSVAVASDQGAVKLRLDPTKMPIVTGSNSSVTVTGTVVNDSATDIVNGTLHIGLSGSLLDTPGAVAQWYSGSSGLAPPVVATASVGAVPVAGSRAFSVTIPAAQIPWNYQLAALPMTLTLTEGSSLTAAATRVSVRSTLDLQRSSVTSPLQIGWVVPLTLPADPDLFGPSGSVRDQAWAKAIGPGSRIDGLLTALADQPVTWLIDPALLDPPLAADDNVPALAGSSTTSPSSSSPSSSPTPSSTPGSTASSTPSSTPGSTAEPTSETTDQQTSEPASTSSTDSSTDATASSTDTTTSEEPIPGDSVARLVAALKTRLTALSSNQTIWWTAYDDPDVAALRTSDPKLLQRDVTRPLPDALRALSATRAIWPAADVTSAQLQSITAQWRAAGQQNPLVLLPRRAAVDDNAAVANSVRQVSGTGGVVLYHELLSSTVAAPGGDPGLRAARFLADTIAVFQQSPGTDRSVTIAVPRTDTASPQDLAATINAIRSASWTTDVTGQEMSTSVATATPATLLPQPGKGTPYPPVAPSPLTAATVDALARQRDRIGVIGSILVNSTDVVTARTQALDSVGSTRWRGDAEGLNAVSQQNTAALRAMIGKVSVNPSTVNFFADSGRLSITVVNELNRPIQNVHLHLQPRKYFIRVPTQPAPLNVRASARTVVRAEVIAVAPGDVTVDATLTNAAGVPLGEPGAVTQLKLNVRPTSTWIYWVLGIVGGLVLTIGLWRSLRHGPRRRTVDPTRAEPTPADAIVATGRERDHAASATTGEADDAPTTKADDTDDALDER